MTLPQLRPSADARRSGRHGLAFALGLAALVVPAVLSAQTEHKAVEPTAAPTPQVAPAGGAPRPEWLRNRIRWSTASEVDNFGYDIFRGLAKEGPFEKVNAKPVLGKGTTDEPQAYEYYDASIEQGVAYWYYVESISIQGEREIFTPIFQAKPKLPPEAAKPESQPPTGGR
jgi:hypothetical protein